MQTAKLKAQHRLLRQALGDLLGALDKAEFAGRLKGIETIRDARNNGRKIYRATAED